MLAIEFFYIQYNSECKIGRHVMKKVSKEAALMKGGPHNARVHFEVLWNVILSIRALSACFIVVVFLMLLNRPTLWLIL